MIDEQTITDLKLKHGSDLHLLNANLGDNDNPRDYEFVVKAPGAEYKRFRAMLRDDTQAPLAMETIARACVVYPDAPTMQALLQGKPAVWDRLGVKIVELAGTDVEVTVKK